MRPPAILILFGLVAATAQAPAFDVASVKPSHAGNGATHSSTNDGQVIRTNYTLYDCIKDAYGLSSYNLAGPEWLKTERYDIVAKSLPPAGRDQLMPMLQTLLTERFHLAVHRESRVIPVYAMTAAKGGARLKAAKPDAENRGSANVNSIGGTLWDTKISMPGFADQLSRHLDRPVRDLTGIEGIYEIGPIEWAADNGTVTDKLTLFEVLRQQLGLVLEAKKLPVEVLVVDRADKVPIEN